MGRVTISVRGRVLLSTVLVTILMVQVLPQVDLPDTVFHRSASPLAMHARNATVRAALTSVALSQLGTSAKSSVSDLGVLRYLPTRRLAGLLELIDRNLRC